MRFLFYLILLSCIFVDYSLTINDTDYIQCTSRCPTITVSFSNPLLFPRECQANNDITNIYDNALVCGIEYRIDYNTEQVSITFHATNETRSLEEHDSTDSLVQTIAIGLSQANPGTNEIIRKYACRTNDCAKEFYFRSINYLINEGSPQLELIRTKLHNDSLLMGEESRRRCIDNSPDQVRAKPSKRCKFGFCYAHVVTYDLNQDQNTKVQKCDGNTNPILFSEIEQYPSKSSSNHRQFVELRCNKNVCNRDDIIEKIQTLLNDYTNLVTQYPDNKNIPQTKTSFSIKQTISSYTLVLLLFLFQLFI